MSDLCKLRNKIYSVNSEILEQVVKQTSLFNELVCTLDECEPKYLGYWGHFSTNEQIFAKTLYRTLVLC